MVLDRRYRLIRRFVGPHSIGGTIAAGRNAEIRALTLIGAVGGVVRPFQERHVDILAGNILDRRITRFPQGQRVPGIGDDAARNLDHDSIAVALDRDRMIPTGGLDGLWRGFFDF
jgi:hypothetical protein